MRIAPEVIIDLTSLPERSDVPFPDLIKGLIEARFEPRASRRLLEHFNGKMKEPLLRPEGVADGGYLVHEDVLFPKASHWWILFQDAEERLSSTLDVDAVSVVADFLRTATHATDPEQVREAWPFDEDAWVRRLVSAPPPELLWPEPSGPGLYRREHASLLIRSRTAGILVDPITLQRRMQSIGQVPGNLRPDAVDAVAITHSHVDHWHMPSLMAHLARADVPVIVPRVTRPNLLTFQDFEAELRTCGQAARAPAWGETLRIGDIEVDILPFYGEQPTREGRALREGLRSWGNCYRFTTEDFSCALLVDTGEDPAGNMLEVMAESCRRRGPVDLLLCCQREFLSPFFGGLHHYWAALPWEHLRSLYEDYEHQRLRCTTAGVAGAVELCAASQARFFLPYANGFEGVGKPITDIGWGLGEPSEASRNALMREELGRRGLKTQVLDWNPGDVARMERGRVELARVLAP
ncbi:MBL fold metallo-hydrolase [Hyalangium gracile]|uniref:MBL fold metallo-hydrolase n=1 Tax=Hyalangium gracile TaxID=394092 RepID=UPI001CCAD7A5|nr:MBL fold metallo-hydrolase [Hyalangium gracile]